MPVDIPPALPGSDEAQLISALAERILAAHPAWPWTLIEEEARRRAAAARPEGSGAGYPPGSAMRVSWFAQGLSLGVPLAAGSAPSPLSGDQACKAARPDGVRR